MQIKKRLIDIYDMYNSEYDNAVQLSSENIDESIWVMKIRDLSLISLAFVVLYHNLDDNDKKIYVNYYEDALHNTIHFYNTYVSSIELCNNEDTSAIISIACLLNEFVGEVLKESFNNKDYTSYDSLSEFDSEFMLNAISFYSRCDFNEWALLIAKGLVSYAKHCLKNNSTRFQSIICELILILSEYQLDYILELYSEYNKLQNYKVTEELAESHWVISCKYELVNDRKAAVDSFWRCYLARKEIYGEDSWYTQMAKRGYALSMIVVEDCMSNNVREILEHFTDCCINNSFTDEIDSESLMQIEGETLYALCNYKYENGSLMLSEVLRYKEIAKIFNDDSSKIYLNLRSAENFLGLYYYMIGDYIKSEKAYINALNTPPTETDLISDDEINFNLLLLYNALNDIDKVFEIYSDIETDDNHLTPEQNDMADCLVCISWLTIYGEPDDEIINCASAIIDDIYSSFLSNEASIYNMTRHSILASLFALIVLISCDVKVNKYLDLLYKYNSLIEKLNFPYELVYLLYYTIYKITDDSKYSAQLLKYIKDEKIYIQGLISVTSDLIQHSINVCDYSLASDLSTILEKKLSEQINSYICYINDFRLNNLCPLLVNPINSIYCVNRMNDNLNDAYNVLLNYKSIESLIGRYRNIIINTYNIDSTLINKINEIQNKLSKSYTSAIYFDQNTDTSSLENELHDLEYQFSIKYPHISKTYKISSTEVLDSIPDNSAIIEYYLYCDEFSNDSSASIDIYLITKKNGETHIGRRSLPNAEEILDRTKKYSTLLYKESTNATSIEDLSIKEDLNNYLYNILIEPELESLSQYRVIYVAPIDELTNIPFELLHNDKHNNIGEEHIVINIECARDFYFSQDNVLGNQFLLIGNPEFDNSIYNQNINSDNEISNRVFSYNYSNINQLPFSEIEVRIASLYCGSNCFMGKDATKELLLNAKDCKVIHLATHGMFDLEEDINALFSSQILFSNITKYGSNGSNYNDGIITADEISRLDLRKTELVMLSTCLSGRSSSSFTKEHQGLIGAFAATGVKYIVSNLWLANDLATSIFMNGFYYSYVQLSKEPYEALYYAKNYLKNISLSEIKKLNIIDYALKSLKMDSDSYESLKKLIKRPDTYRPFKHEKYWGGFICYQCY